MGKAAASANADFFAWLEANAEGLVAGDEALLEHAIATSIAFKAGVVARDERERGERMLLNLGHTVGHALETTLGYGTLRHGEAVGLGLLAALRLSGLSDLRGQVAALLEAAGLPTTLHGFAVDPDAIVAATRLDKKRTAQARTPFVLVRAPGDVVEGQDVADDDVALAVRELTVT